MIAIHNAQVDLALLNSITVESGPVCVDDDEWLRYIGDAMPEFESYADRYLAFLKTQVITSESIRNVLMFLWNVEEVTVEGLKQAFDSFWSILPRRRFI
jgi:hypothetical protein